MKDQLLKGKYWISDLCYVYPDELWSDFCDELAGDDWYEFEGKEFFVASSRWGDGGFPVLKNGQIIGEFSVDAGLFAVIPEELLTRWNADLDKCRRLGVFIELEEDTEFSCNDGNLSFGEYEALTDWDEEDEEEEQNEEDETD